MGEGREGRGGKRGDGMVWDGIGREGGGKNLLLHLKQAVAAYGTDCIFF